MMGSVIRIFAELPLTTLGRQFDLYHVHNFPVYNESNQLSTYYLPHYNFLAVSYDGSSYYESDGTEFNKCIGTSPRICKPLHAIRHLPEPSCTIALFKMDHKMRKEECKKHVKAAHRTKFIRTPGDDKWAYSVKGHQNLMVNCLNENQTGKAHESTSTMILHNYGIITLKKNCYARMEGYTLLPHREEIVPIHSSQDRFTVPGLLPMNLRKKDEQDDHIAIKAIQRLQKKNFTNMDVDIAQLQIMADELEEVKQGTGRIDWLDYLLPGLITTTITVIIITILCLRRSHNIRINYAQKEEERYTSRPNNMPAEPPEVQCFQRIPPPPLMDGYIIMSPPKQGSIIQEGPSTSTTEL